jgi:hypothetical protein
LWSRERAFGAPAPSYARLRRAARSLALACACGAGQQLGVALAALALASPMRAAAPPAAGGADIVAALERAPVSVVGVLRDVRRLDDEAWTARMAVERALAGAPGDTLVVAWEEHARSRAVRFDVGDRVLVALEALPGHSIWRQRIPDREQRAATLAVADAGEAFLRQPAGGSVSVLEHYLALGPRERERNPGIGYLVRLARDAQPALAESAVARMARVSDLDRALDASSAARLVAALVRPDATQRLTSAILDLVEARRLESLRPALEAGLEASERPPAPIVEALARLDAGLSSDRSLELLGWQDAPAHRAIGARYASGEAVDRLPRLLRVDRDPDVRAAAVTRWVELRGPDGVERALVALEDSDPEVRRATLLAIGSLGPEVVPPLRDVALNGPPHAAGAAVGALRASGSPEAWRVLEEIAASHPDEGVRLLARSALGRPLGHRH